MTVNSLNGADIYLNGSKVGTTRYSEELTPGLYDFEARLASHRTVSRQVEVKVNQPQTITLNPTPIYGSLDVVTEPMKATVTINGKSYGFTPTTIENLLVGDYQVGITKEGYASVTKSVTIRENQTSELSVTLQNSVSVYVECTPSNAKLYLDGKYLGTGSGSYQMPLGSHTLKGEAEKYRESAQSVTITSSTSRLTMSLQSVFANQTFTVNGVSFTMVAVEGGTFTMGTTSEQGSDADDDEKPAHSVTLSRYYIGQTEVTQALWKAVLGSNPSYFEGDNLPVEQVSWNDCQEFVRKLNQLTGKKFRLPTEAEWEYAARGGRKSRGYKYAGSNTLDEVAWYYDNSDRKTHPVGTKKANELGLYDMSGNVWEWCQDWYGSYRSGSQTNPTGPKRGSYRVNRGGSWDFNSRRCRVSCRFNSSPSISFNDLGLRLVLEN